MLFYNFGLFWKKRDVHWGRQGVAGHLSGRLATNVTADVVDFRDQSGIYVLQSSFRVVYVGQAGYGNQKLFERLKQHTKDHLADRWDTFSWFGTRDVISGGYLKAEKDNYSAEHGVLLNHLEAILIAVTEPPLNRQGGKFGSGVDQYLQHRDEDSLGPSPDDMIQEVWRRLRETK